MTLHTLKSSLHTLIKSTEYQMDNILVHAVYAKNRKLFNIFDGFKEILSICFFVEEFGALK